MVALLTLLSQLPGYHTGDIRGREWGRAGLDGIVAVVPPDAP